MRAGAAEPAFGSRRPYAPSPQTGPPMRQASSAATAHREALRFAEALPLFEAEVAACLRDAEDEVECFELLMRAGQTSALAPMGGRTAADAARTEAYFRRALSVARQSFSPDDFRLANAAASLAGQLATPMPGSPAETPARLAEAELLLRTSLAVFPARNNLFEFDWEQTLQVVLARAGRRAEATAILVRRLDEARARYGRDYWGLWQPLRDLAIELAAAGDHIGAARAWEEAVELAAAHYPADDHQLLGVKSGLANARYVTGDLEGSADIYAEMQDVIGAIGDNSLLDLFSPNYVANYAELLTTVGRPKEAIDLMEARVPWLIRLRGAAHPDARTAAFSLASLYVMDGRNDDGARLFEILLRLGVQEDGADATSTLLVRSAYATALARSGDGDGALLQAEISLSGLRPSADQAPHLLTGPLWILGVLRLERNQIDVARGHLYEALTLQVRQWCPAAESRGSFEWSGVEGCRSHRSLPILTANTAHAETRGAPRPGRAARLLVHASDMALDRTRLRFSADPAARKEFDRSRPIHADFVTAAWSANDLEAAALIARQPVRVSLSAIDP